MRVKVLLSDQINLEYDTTKKTWYIIGKESNSENDLSIEKNLVSALKVLHQDPDLFFDTVKKVQGDKYLSEDIANSFPLKQLIFFCIKNDLIYWLELSLKWLKFIKIDSELFVALVEVINSKKYPQKLRHQLSKQIT